LKKLNRCPILQRGAIELQIVTGQAVPMAVEALCRVLHLSRRRAGTWGPGPR